MNSKKSSPIIQIAYTLITLIVGAVIGTITQEWLGEILKSETFVLLIIFICLGLLSLMIYQLVRQTDEIRHNVGIKIIYYDQDRYGKPALFIEARKIIEKAEHSIFVLNSFLTDQPEVSDDDSESANKQKHKPSQEKEKYYDAMLEKAIKKNVVYERILQLKEGQAVEEIAENVKLRKHFHKMLDEKEKNPSLQIGLIKTPARRFATFVLVDEESLIWQINHILQSGDVQMHGVFIIQDPRHEITQHFRSFIESARRDSLGAVQRNELPPLK